MATKGWGFSKYGFGPKKWANEFDKVLFGTRGKHKQISNLDANQQELLQLIKQGLAEGEGPLADIFNFDEEKFKEGVSNPVMKQFQEEVLPQLQHKFIANNQILGSSFNKAQAKAGTDLQSKLAALMYEAQQGKEQNKLAGAQTVLGVKPFENQYRPGDKGLIKGFLQGAAPTAGKAATAAIAG